MASHPQAREGFYHAQLDSLADELLFQLGLGGDDEGDVHAGAHRLMHRSCIEAVGVVHGVVQYIRLSLVQLLPAFKPALLKKVVEHEAAHVDAPAGGCVVQGVLHGLVVHGHWADLPGNTTRHVIAMSARSAG